MSYDVTATQYKKEWITPFQRGETYLKETVMKEQQVMGTSSATFAVEGISSGMTERGANGLIPSRRATDRQVVATLKERHSLENHTDFNVFTSQGGKLRQAMQTRSRMDSYREIDDEILLAMQTATNQFNGGAAANLTFGSITDMLSDLWAKNVDQDITCVWTPKSWAKIHGLKEFTSIDWSGDKKLASGRLSKPKVWAGATHFIHTGLPGMGTATAKNYMYSKSAIGHCIAGDVDIDADYNREQKYSWDRATIYHVSVVLQQEGLMEITTDDTVAIA